jgi:hypothetical protein
MGRLLMILKYGSKQNEFSQFFFFFGKTQSGWSSERSLQKLYYVCLIKTFRWNRQEGWKVDIDNNIWKNEERVIKKNLFLFDIFQLNCVI